MLYIDIVMEKVIAYIVIFPL